MEPEFIASFWTLAGNTHPRDSWVSVLPLETRVEAAAEAGFRGFSFTDTDLAAVRQSSRWRDYADIRRLLDANDLRVVELELIRDWFAMGERKAASDRIRAQLFEAAAELGANHIKILGDFTNQYPVAQMADGFGEVCNLAARIGVKIAVELTPLTNLFAPQQVIDLVRSSGTRNGGMLLDVWHMGRGGIPFDSLADIPAELIIGVELDDADLEVRGTLMEDSMNNRRLCGEGQLEPAKLIAAVQRAGYQGLYGVEILSDEHRARDVKVAARVAIESARAQFPQHPE